MSTLKLFQYVKSIANIINKGTYGSLCKYYKNTMYELLLLVSSVIIIFVVNTMHITKKNVISFRRLQLYYTYPEYQSLGNYFIPLMGLDGIGPERSG
jgi:hypothetical protein